MFEDKRANNQQGFFNNLMDYLVMVVMNCLPHIPFFDKFKSNLMRMRGANIGKNAKFFSGIWIDRFDTVHIEDDVSIGKNVIMIASGGIKIGARTMVGHRTTLLSVNHKIPTGKQNMRFAGSENAPVIIEEDVWIGAHSVIVPGITIGKGSIIGAGSVVTKNIPVYMIVGGVPARTIGKR